MTTTTSTATSTPALAFRPRTGLRIVPVRRDLWRVVRADGVVLGYVERRDEGASVRFRAQRLRALERRFVPLGDFWSPDEAVDCFAW